MAPPSDPDTDEWEVIYDDGLVYKRKRRHLDPIHLPKPSFPDPDLEQKYKTRRKLKALLKIKAKYQKEIQLWEGLADKLKHLEQSVLSNNVDNDNNGKVVEGDRRDCGESSGSGSGLKDKRKAGSIWIDDVFMQVEAQSAAIQNLSNLCDVADALCDAIEEKNTESFFDLPVWGSPRELTASLSDD